MNFQRKAVYATAMGIDLWVARKPLSGAQKNHKILSSQPSANIESSASNVESSASNVEPSANNIEPSAVNVEPSANNAVSTRRELANPAADLAKRLDVPDHPQGLRVKESKAPKRVSPQAQQSANSTYHFELSAIVHDGLLLVDDISGLKLTASAYQDWLSAIFLAVGKKPLSRSLTRQDRMEWPADIKNMGVRALNQQAAMDMVAAWLQRKLDADNTSPKITYALLMGDAAHTMLLDAKSLHCEVSQSPALKLSSTAELWQSVQSKRQLWSQLLTLSL